MDNKKRLVRSRSGLRVVSLDEECTSPFELKEPFWVPDDESPCCTKCQAKFDFLTRRHHCRRCGNVFCSHCCEQKVPLPRMCFVDPVRVCAECRDVTKKENDFYDKHLKILLAGASFILDVESGSGMQVPIACCLSKDHQAVLLEGGSAWQHEPIPLTNIISLRVVGSTGSPGPNSVMGSVIRYLDFKKDEMELRLCVIEGPNRKQSVTWINALQKASPLNVS
ncbi:zinc finger FYVE domain-containing protein 21-like [Uloborus diversus]|uniref:zinc finger FYVE domain-containing protein 21-like n=1 Tax=Uloborus diversus TaxID=327109 RepID=UPI00240A3B40|nr:zinc finger FYVE domain-containing protein 21-like [Uloborus diversus]